MQDAVTTLFEGHPTNKQRAAMLHKFLLLLIHGMPICHAEVTFVSLVERYSKSSKWHGCR